MELMERRRILLNTPHINIITGLQFVTDMVAPLESLVIGFSPIQDLHGYNSPWPAGGGKNLLNANADTGSSNNVNYIKNGDGTYTVNGTADGTSSFIVGSIELTANTQYVLSGCPNGGSGSSYNVRIRDANYTALGFDAGNGTTITPTETKTYYYQITVVSGYSVSNLVFKPMICLSTTSDPDYAHFAPYSNICPIGGRTGMDVTRTGKNLANMFNDGKIPSISNGQLVTGNGLRSDYISMDGDTQITFSGNTSSTIYCFFYDSGKNLISFNANTSPMSVTTPSNTAYIMLRADASATSLQLELSSTATTYEPYTATTLSIDWTSEAGTVYGGTLDVITGELTVTHALYTFDGSSDEVWTHYTVTQGEMFRTRIPERKPGELTTISGTICDSYKVSGQSDRTDGTVSGSSTLIDFVNNNYSTTTEWTANLAEHPVSIVCELNTPSTYQLTPQQVLAFKGINNLSMSGQVKFWTHRD